MAPARDWIRCAEPVEGVERFRAWFAGAPYQRHRHDTYAIGITDSGAQVFHYRGARRASTPGQVFVLHPDEPHDGRAGTEEGFGYRQLYVEPARIAEAARVLCARPCPLPFVAEPVSANRLLGRAVRAAFHGPLQALAADDLVLALARGLLAAAGSSPGHASSRIDVGAVARARELLDAACPRAVHAPELEAASGLGRYELARQFRLALGTSPYRYLLMRRLDRARQAIRQGVPLAQAACAAGFADQPHLTRAFKAAHGMTPARYRALWTRTGG